MTQTQVDLRELALERPEPHGRRPRRRPWMARYALPSVILLGFAALLLFAAGDQLLPRTAVTVTPVVVTRAEVQQEGSPLFQAAGWVEPRPTPINVPALTEGVVEQLLVVEGQQVAAGEPVARLIDVDAKLVLQQAEANLRLREAELKSAEAELRAAQTRLQQPVHLDAELADAESVLAKTETAKSQVPFLIDGAKARVEYARQNLEGKQAAENAIVQRLVQQAQSDLASAQAELQELEQRLPRLESEAEALRRKVEALSKQRDLLVDESRQVAEAEARRQAAHARLDEASLAVEKAKLALDRTIVRAPTAGRILSLVAFPGTHVVGVGAGGASSHSTVASLYDPAMLQVRADVRLEDVPHVQVGQPVEIETPSSKETIAGTVLLPTSSANIQKNTLEVKIAIDDPPTTIRPEMLVTATFLAPPQTAMSPEKPPHYEHLLVPRRLVDSSEDGAAVWIVTAEGVAERRAVKLGRAGNNDLVEVIEGLTPTDKVIASGQQSLEPGTRVTITGGDATIGKGQSSDGRLREEESNDRS